MPKELARIELQMELAQISSPVHVTGFTGHENISKLFFFDVELAIERKREKNREELAETEADRIDFSKVVGQKAQLSISRGSTQDSESSKVHAYHGIIGYFEQGERGERFAMYRAHLVPQVWLLTKRRNCRIFQEESQNIQTIIETVLGEHKLKADRDFRFIDAADPLPLRSYCVQYQETDWAFIERLLAEEGLFYFFQHDGERTVLVMAREFENHPSIAGGERDEIPKLPYMAEPSNAVEAGEEYIDSFRLREQISSGRVALRDWDFENPLLSMDSQAPKQDSMNDLEFFNYPGRYPEAADHDDTGTEPKELRAELQLEALQHDRRIASGASNCTRLLSGHTFELSGRHCESFVGQYILAMVKHYGESQLRRDGTVKRYTYRNEFHCIPDKTVFRPAVLPKSSPNGLQTAVVVGPENEEIYVDQYGRIKVKFHWDRSEDTQDATCWIRVAQASAGAGFGTTFIPRIGQEVVVGFQDGDPDRPLVTGVVYNGLHPPPYSLPERKTVTTMRTRSTPDGDGFNELRFEDKKDREEVYLHAQKNLVQEIENNVSVSVGSDHEISINGSSKTSVQDDQSIVVKAGNQDITVEEGDAILHVNTRDRRVCVKEQYRRHAKEIHDEAEDSFLLEAGPNTFTMNEDGSECIVSEGDQTVTVSEGDANLSVDTGKRRVKVKNQYALRAKTILVEASDKLELKAGGHLIKVDKRGIEIKVGKSSIKLSKSDVTVKGTRVKMN